MGGCGTRQRDVDDPHVQERAGVGTFSPFAPGKRVTLRRLPRSACDARVLVIDDLQANLDAVGGLLAQAGLSSIATERSGRGALDRYRAVRPDLVLLDWHMPEMNGLAVLRELRATIGPDEYVPIIVLTADTTSDTRDAALDAGATDFLTKPLDVDETILRVRNLLEVRALHRRLSDSNTQLSGQLRARDRRERSALAAREKTVESVAAVIAQRATRIVFQPIIDLSSGTTVGAEALTRFPPPSLPPDLWFADAHAVGLGIELELLAVEQALTEIHLLPPGAFVSINVAATTVCDPGLESVLAVAPGARVVLELTEHTRVVDYDAVVGSLDRFRLQGIRIAVDDAGAGYAGLQHILKLQPDVIKLDRELIIGIDGDPARRALVSSQVFFGAEVGATILAEGIETAAEHDTLRDLGVPWGQGYLFARPGTVPFQKALSVEGAKSMGKH